MVDGGGSLVAEGAIAVEAAVFAGGGEDAQVLRERRAPRAVARHLVDDGRREHVDLLQVARPPIVGDHLERLAVRGDEGDRAGRERDLVGAFAPGEQWRSAVGLARVEGAQNVDLEYAGHVADDRAVCAGGELREVADAVALRRRADALEHLGLLAEHGRLTQVEDDGLVPIEACKLGADRRERNGRRRLARHNARDRLQQCRLVGRRH